MSHIISKTAVSYALGVTGRTVTRYQTDQKNPLPVIDTGRGVANEYDIKDFADWLQKHAIRDILGDDGTLYSYEVEKARLTHHQANKAELESKVMEGKLLDAEEVVHEMSGIVSELRSRLLALPLRVAQVAISDTTLNEIESNCRDEVYAMLEELAKNAERYTE